MESLARMDNFIDMIEKAKVSSSNEIKFKNLAKVTQGVNKVEWPNEENVDWKDARNAVDSALQLNGTNGKDLALFASSYILILIPARKIRHYGSIREMIC